MNIDFRYRSIEIDKKSCDFEEVDNDFLSITIDSFRLLSILLIDHSQSINFFLCDFNSYRFLLINYARRLIILYRGPCEQGGPKFYFQAEVLPKSLDLGSGNRSSQLVIGVPSVWEDSSWIPRCDLKSLFRGFLFP